MFSYCDLFHSKFKIHSMKQQFSIVGFFFKFFLNARNSMLIYIGRNLLCLYLIPFPREVYLEE